MIIRRRSRECSFKAYILLLVLLFNIGCAFGRYSLNGECRMNYCFKIENVPFIAQKANYCGPASLAMVMNYYKINISQDDIAKEIYEPGLDGTLSMQMLIYPIQKGFEAEIYNGNLEDLKEKIRARFPLIVSVKEEGESKAHYMIVWGYDDWDKQLFVNSGDKKALRMDYDRFLDMWEKTRNLTVWVYPGK